MFLGNPDWALKVVILIQRGYRWKVVESPHTRSAGL
jgi:hypothetical protein